MYPLLTKPFYTLSVIVFGLLCLPVLAQANNFPQQQHFAGHDLQLNGQGTRSKLFFNLYNAGLYLSQTSQDAPAILIANQPQALRLEITSGQINSENMEEAVRKGFQQSAGDTIDALQSRINQLIAVFKQPIKAGDIYDFVYRPQNLIILKNGQQAAAIPGLDFKQAFLGIWLGDQPTQNSLKKALLNQ